MANLVISYPLWLTMAKFSLAPGFSRVWLTPAMENRFNGFMHGVEETAEAVEFIPHTNTRLKPGANERRTHLGPNLLNHAD